MRLQKRFLITIFFLLLFTLLSTVIGLTWLARQSLLTSARTDAEQIAEMLAQSLTLFQQIPVAVEARIAEQMLAQAHLTSHLVAIAEQNDLPPAVINRHFKELADKTVLDEFWVTDDKGHAYLRNVEVDFTFNPSPTAQPQAHVFWKLLTGEKETVVQKAQVREIDHDIYKYVGVNGIDKPRIVQIGYHFSFLKQLRAQLGIENLVKNLVNAGHAEAIWVIDRQLNVLAAEVSEGITIHAEKLSEEFMLLQDKVMANQEYKTHYLNGKYLKIATPLIDKHKEVTGAALIYLSTENIQDLLIHQGLFVVLITSGILMIGFIVTYLLSTQLTKPVRNLQSAAVSLAKGEWNQKLPTQRQDELGDLARTFSNMAGQLKTMFDELEKRVAERTVSLTQANEEIKNLNKKLKAENLRMSAELEVTQRLQKMLLPKEQELKTIPTLEIAGYMQPAEEVGGDYYDVLQQNGRVKIGIGDVTGHGLESSVLMLMVQTAVRTLLVHNETDPGRFLNTLNRIIYDNVKRMGSDKNLTLCLVDYEGDHLYLTGQHEEMIIIRNDGSISRYDTVDLGFPIGLEQDITQFVAEIKIDIAPGEVVVLYTDGITEAENDEKELYGIDRLCDVVRSHFQASAQVIRQAIIENVLQHIDKHTIYDDITLLVIKRKL